MVPQAKKAKRRVTLIPAKKFVWSPAK